MRRQPDGVVLESIQLARPTLRLSMRNPAWVITRLSQVTVPLMLLSGIMLPLVIGPGWLQAIARAPEQRAAPCRASPVFSSRLDDHGTGGSG